jgi:hypothetical protein
LPTKLSLLPLYKKLARKLKAKHLYLIFVNMEKKPKDSPISEAAPFFKTWTPIYWIVVGFLAFCIGFFYFLTLFFSN